MSAAAIVFLVILILNLSVALAKHGQPRPAYNFWIALFGAGVTLALLWWGGFFAAK